ncbi:MAG: HAMP domain-containing histidine kinase, partial [Burkholderiales bacterium]|nr:HAMP domain-containing histidine kinase [Burkholderiales bacterium]
STLADKLREFEANTEQNFTRKTLRDYLVDAKCGIDILQQNLARSATLISSFKQLAADQHSEQRRHFRLHDMMEETVMAMMPSISKTGHQLQLDIDHNIMMDAYPGPLSQIIINFINNALLHAFDGKQQGKMQISARLSDPEHVEICFSDDGVGIPAAIIQRVFEPFFTTKLGKGGSGLGMHLVHSMVTQMFGGRIELRSIPNQGTQITMQLPLVAPDNTRHVLKIGAPADVVKDFHLFLSQRPIADIHEFNHPHSRRDVVELTLFLQALLRLEPKVDYELTTVDSYAIGIEQLRAGKIAALATTVWKSDLTPYPKEIQLSDAIIGIGESEVGVFTTQEKLQSLSGHQLDDLRPLRFVSNRDWSADWKAIQALGVEHCADVKTWRQMVYMVSSGECDALLAPFNQHPNAEIELDDCRLLPIPGIKINLNDSRHFAASKDAHATIIISNVFPQLKDLVNNGQIEKALRECGFFIT